MKDDKYITRKEAADYLGVSLVTIYNYEKRGYFTSRHFERNALIDREEFMEFVERCFKVHARKITDTDTMLEEINGKLKYYVTLQKKLHDKVNLHKSAEDFALFFKYYHPKAILSEYIHAVAECLDEPTDFMKESLEIVEKYCHGYSTTAIAQKYNVSTDCIRKRSWRGVKLIKEHRHLMSDLMKENRELRKRCARQHRAIIQYAHENARLSKLADAGTVNKVSSESLAIAKAKEYIIDYRDVLKSGALAVRSVNVLKALKVESMYDLLLLTPEEIHRSWAAGDKTLLDIENYVSKYAKSEKNQTLRLGCFKL